MARLQKLNCSKTEQDEILNIFDEVVDLVRNLLIGIAFGGIGLGLVLVWWIYG